MNTKIKTEERMSRLVVAVGKGAAIRKELIEALGLCQSAQRNFRDNYLHPALKRGLIKMSFPEVPTSPVQSYRLTPKGLELLAQCSAKKD